MPFKPGQSGNPRGRLPGAFNRDSYRSELGKHIPEIMEKMSAMAKAGDTMAAKLILDRVLPQLRPADPYRALGITGSDLTDAAKQTINALGSANINPDQCAKIMQAISTASHVIAVDELLKRVEALERKGVTPDPEVLT